MTLWPRVRQQWWVLLIASCVGVAAIVVPPLVIPHGGHEPPGAVLPAVSSAPVVTASVATSPAVTASMASSSAVTTTPGPYRTPASSRAAAPRQTRSPAAFAPVTVEAEDPGNLLTAPAEAVACASCEGGYRVRYIGFGAGQVVVRTTLPMAGMRTVTVVYESDGPRTFKISINGAAPLTQTAFGPGWTTPERFQFNAVLPAGTLLLTFYNDESPAPDLDAVTIA